MVIFLQTYTGNMLIAKILLTVSVTTALTACGGGALVNQNSNTQQGETEFCGVSVTFASKPRQIPKHQLEEFLDAFGRYIKNNITGLFSENHHLIETALCVCKDTSEVSNRASDQWKTNITPSSDSINFKKDTIDGIGATESWDYTDAKSNTKFSYKVIDLSSRSSCQLVMSVARPANSSEKYFSFLNSISESKSNITNKVKSTPKDRLIQLDALRKDGLINQADYDLKKKMILDQL